MYECKVEMTFAGVALPHASGPCGDMKLFQGCLSICTDLHTHCHADQGKYHVWVVTTTVGAARGIKSIKEVVKCGT